jgi:hypothetical protein
MSKSWRSREGRYYAYIKWAWVIEHHEALIGSVPLS